jgi:hypothetical protein
MADPPLCTSWTLPEAVLVVPVLLVPEIAHHVVVFQPFLHKQIAI